MTNSNKNSSSHTCTQNANMLNTAYEQNKNNKPKSKQKTFVFATTRERLCNYKTDCQTSFQTKSNNKHLTINKK